MDEGFSPLFQPNDTHNSGFLISWTLFRSEDTKFFFLSLFFLLYFCYLLKDGSIKVWKNQRRNDSFRLANRVGKLSLSGLSQFVPHNKIS